MPVPDLETYKVALQEVSSSTKFNNLVQAVEDEFAAIDNDNISAGATIAISKLQGYPASALKYLRGDGTWPGDYSTWALAWTSTGTAPALGNSSVLARYIQIGKLVHAHFEITFGSTATFGTGDYRFSLPVPASVSAQSRDFAHADLFDASAPARGVAMPEIVGTTAVQITFGSTYFGPGAVVGQTVPWTWAQNDLINVNMLYEPA